MAHPPEVQAFADELASLYRNVHDSLIAELERIAADPNQRRLRRRLNEQVRAIDQALDQVDTQARVYLSRRFPTIYQIGAVEAARATGRPWTWSQLHTDAVSEIANRTYADLLKATRHVRADSKRFIRAAVRERTALSVIGGQTATQAGRELAKTLSEQGIKAVRYSNGALHSLSDYADMVARTTTAEAYNMGTLRGGREAGVEWFHVFDGLDCGWDSHKSTDLAAGTVRRAEDCEAHPISHPRCARSFSPAPEVTNAKEAEAARQFAPEEQQRLAAEERERARTHTVQGRLTQRERDRREGLRTRARERQQRERERARERGKRLKERERQRRERLRARERRLAARQRRVRT
jgi:hypothetical protein